MKKYYSMKGISIARAEKRLMELLYIVKNMVFRKISFSPNMVEKWLKN